MVVALPERLRSIRDVAIVAEDRQPGAHPQCGVLSNPLGQDFAVVVIRVLRRHVPQQYRVVQHALHPLANGILSVGYDYSVLVPNHRVANYTDCLLGI